MGDAAGGECAPPCVALLRDKDTWLFDVGEDVQRSLLSREHLRPSKVGPFGREGSSEKEQGLGARAWGVCTCTGLCGTSLQLQPDCCA